jgi:hypothetical protein
VGRPDTVDEVTLLVDEANLVYAGLCAGIFVSVRRQSSRWGFIGKDACKVLFYSFVKGCHNQK